MERPGAERGLIEALGGIVGPRWVRHRPAELATYAADGLPTHESLPGLVVLPGSRDEVARVLRLLHLLQVPFVARGAGIGRFRSFQKVSTPRSASCTSSRMRSSVSAACVAGSRATWICSS